MIQVAAEALSPIQRSGVIEPRAGHARQPLLFEWVTFHLLQLRMLMPPPPPSDTSSCYQQEVHITFSEPTTSQQMLIMDSLSLKEIDR